MTQDNIQGHLARIRATVVATGSLHLMTPFAVKEDPYVCKDVMNLLNQIAHREGFAHYAFVSRYCGRNLTLKFIDMAVQEDMEEVC